MQRNEMVGKYLEVLGLRDRPRDFDLVAEVVRRHVATFAFSSVAVRLGEELPLDFASLFDRIVVRRRGGYCFEQNGLAFGILEEAGFRPELHLARVLKGQDDHPGLTHRISLVEHDGLDYVFDVGFGSTGPRVPVPMSGCVVDDGPHRYRVAEDHPGEYHLQVARDGDFSSLYRFELSRCGPADCELGHFYSHRHPDAVFVNNLVVSLRLTDETRALRNLLYRVESPQGIRTTRIDGADQLRDVLVDDFGLQVTDEETDRLYGDLRA